MQMLFEAFYNRQAETKIVRCNQQQQNPAQAQVLGSTAPMGGGVAVGSSAHPQVQVQPALSQLHSAVNAQGRPLLATSQPGAPQIVLPPFGAAAGGQVGAAVVVPPQAPQAPPPVGQGGNQGNQPAPVPQLNPLLDPHWQDVLK